MSFNTPWPRVYPGLSKCPPAEVRRLTIEMPTEDATTIMSVALNNAIFSLICQTALRNAAQHIRKHELKYADSESFVNFICNGTHSGDVETTAEHDESGRTTSIRKGTAKSSHQSAGARKEVTGGKRKGKDDGEG